VEYGIDEWLRERPSWLQEAASRLCKRKIIDQDIEELASLCLTGVDPDAMKESTNFSLSGMDGKMTGRTTSLRLLEVGNVQGINALNPRKPLAFSENNLVVIYGQNGSGKSGYVRILKSASGSGKSEEPILADVYAEEEQEQQCEIKLLCDGIQLDCQWKASDGVLPELAGLNIFDTICGRIYVTDENETSFEPPVLQFFSELILICQKVAKHLDDQIDKIPSTMPAMPLEYAVTSAAKWYKTLSYMTSPEDIDKHCNWSEANEKELVLLQQRILEQAPIEKAKQYLGKKQHVDRTIAEIEKALSTYNDHNIKRIWALREDWNGKETAAKLAAESMFAAAPLPGVGEEVWKQLWDAARKYSQEVAYPGLSFPHVMEGAHCVLCQQRLSDEALDRFTTFEEFVKGHLQNTANEARQLYETEISSLGTIPSVEIIRAWVNAAELSQPVEETIIQLFQVFSVRREQLLQQLCVEKIVDILSADALLSQLRQIAAEYDGMAKQYQEDAEKDARADIEARKKELEAHKWLAQQRSNVLAEVDRLVLLEKYRAAKDTTNTAIISKKKGEVAEKCITEAYIARFNAELEKLGAKKISIELVKSKVNKGKVLHCVRLKSSSHVSPKDVLSEGEFRIVSLAAFLADMLGKDQKAPFIFDDPISSLDLIYEEKVARRLVELATDWQVIVLTHRLSMVSLLETYGESASKPKIICMRREFWGTGEPGDTPLSARNPISAVNQLHDERLAKARKALREQGSEEYTPQVQAICSDFRVLLERTIEIKLLGGVVERFRREVHTKKIPALSKITKGDCDFFDEMMTKYSCYEHSQARETPVYLPEPDELAADLLKLKAWCNEFDNRASG